MGAFILKNLLKLVFSLLLFTVIFGYDVHAETQYRDMTAKLNVDRLKTWTVKFTTAVKPETITTKNLIVKDESNNIINISVSVKGDKEVVITPNFGFIPDRNYYLYIDGVQDINGKTLKAPVRIKFAVAGDKSSVNNLPQISGASFKTPLLSSEYQEFNIVNNSGQELQYRIFVNEYKNYRYNGYVELTDGYVAAINNKIIANKKLKSGGDKVKFIIYVKKTGTTGSSVDLNTRYDNYYVDYFRVLDKISVFTNTDSESYSTKDCTSAIAQLINNANTFSGGEIRNMAMTNEGFSKDVYATKNEVKFYLNTNNFKDDTSKYMFLNLKYMEGLTGEALDLVLNKLPMDSVLRGKGKVFLEAGKANNVNPIYLVCHALLETGNGTSALAKGIMVDGQYGKKIAYNIYGIGAYDGSANSSGAQSAYKNSWFTVEDAIKGGAAWIGPRYINAMVGPQDTLYEMKWNLNQCSNPWHQYATDIGWAYKQTKRYKPILDQIQNVKLNYDFAKFNK